MWKYQETDELYHYGILGMKWGQHITKNISPNTALSKSRKNINNRKNQMERVTNRMISEHTSNVSAFKKQGLSKKQAVNKADKIFIENLGKEEKKYSMDMKKLEAINKNAKKHATTKEKIKDKLDSRVSEKTQKYISENVSNGKAVVQSLLMGSYGSLVYNSARSKGRTKGEAALQAIVNNGLNNISLGYMSRHARW